MRGESVVENGAMAEALEEVGSLGHEVESGDISGIRRHVAMQIYLPRKKAIQLEEIRLRRMKKGQDTSRSRLVSEAVDLLAERENPTKSNSKAD